MLELLDSIILNRSFLSGLACGIFLSFTHKLCTLKLRKPAESNKNAAEHEDESPASSTSASEDDSDDTFGDATEEYKMVLLVRTDLKMGKGKVAAQCAHAAVGAYHTCRRTDPKSLRIWESTGQAKIALKIDSEDEMLELMKIAKDNGLITSLIRDAGRTQISPNTKTVLAIGPAPKESIDLITGHLKLL